MPDGDGCWSIAVHFADPPDEKRIRALVALAAAIPTALLIAWAFSSPLGRRVREIAAVANRYSSGEPPRGSLDYGNDELGTVARRVHDALARALQLDEAERGHLFDLARVRTSA